MSILEFIIFKSAKQTENANDSSDVKFQTNKATKSIL
jgi:hypothetical protein